jgi:hypothetical protein
MAGVKYMYIFTKATSSIPVRGEVYSIQLYAIKIASYLLQVDGWYKCTPFSSTNKTDSHDIKKYCFKVAYNNDKEQL